MNTRVILKYAAAAVAAVVVLGALAAWLVPPYVKRLAEEKAGEALGRKVSIGSVSINPFLMQVVVEGLTIHARESGAAPLLSIESVDAALGMATFTRFAPALSHLHIRQPKLVATRLDAQRYDFSDIVDRVLAGAPSASPQSPRAFVLNHIELTGGGIDFDDRPERTRHQIRELRWVVPFVSSLDAHKNEPVQPELSADVNGMRLDLSGRLTPFADARGASLKIDFKGLDLTKYVEYVPFKLGVRLASAVADGDLALDMTNDKEKGFMLSLKGVVGLDKWDLRERSGAPMLAFSRLETRLAGIEPLARAFNVDSVALTGLDLRVRRGVNGMNLEALLPPANAEANESRPAQDATRVSRFQLGEFSLKEARVEFVDETVSPVFRTQAEGIAVNVRGLSTVAEAKASIEAALSTRAGEKLEASANGSIQPMAWEGTVRLDGARLANYAAYLAPYLDGMLEGTMGASSAFRLSAGSAAAPLRFKLVAPALRLAQLTLARTGAPMLRLSTVELKAADVDSEKRVVSGVELKLADGRLEARREADGSIDISRLARAQAPPQDDKSPLPTTSATSQSQAQPWRVDVKQASVDRFAIRFSDATVTPPVSTEIEPVSLLATGLSTQAGVQGRVEAKFGLNRSGTLEFAGPLSMVPLAGKLSLDARDVGVVAFQPYFRPFINALVTAGGLSAKGTLDISEVEGAPRIAYDGEVGVGGFTLMDATAAERLVGFKSLRFEEVQAVSRPFSLGIGQISLSEFFASLVIQPGGRINLQDIVPPAKPAANAATVATPGTAAKPPVALSSASSASAAPTPIKIGRATLQGGMVEFSDRNLKPNFSAKLTGLAGRVSGLSPDPASRAELELKGQVDGVAPLDIAGRLNPLSGNLFVDLKASAKGIDLNALTPYSAKYVGYGIEKGKLSLDLAYKIENGRLDAQNRVFLDQLTFGEAVDSPDAIKAPVLLAVALLKNSRGEIDINLPIGGSLKDPEFSVGGIVVQLIFNIIVKAVTAPFALLASLFGGGEDLSFLEFTPGSALIGANEEGRLSSLAKALGERGALRLEIAGRVDEESDRDGLKRAMLAQKVRAQKVAATVVAGADVKSASDVTVTPAEYPVLLKRAYDRETFAKPRNAIGLARELPVPEMEALMLTHAEVGQQQLRELARHRAETVREWMIGKGGVAQERIFLVEPREEQSDKEARAKARASRVDMYIR